MSGFQPPNSTQVLLQPSSTRSWLKPRPPINELAIVMALSQQPLTQTAINASPSEMGAVQGKRTVFSTLLCIGGHSSGPLRVNQGVFKVEPRDGHAVCTVRVHPPTSPYPALSAEAEPISEGHCRKWHHKMLQRIVEHPCGFLYFLVKFQWCMCTAHVVVMFQASFQILPLHGTLKGGLVDRCKCALPPSHVSSLTFCQCLALRAFSLHWHTVGFSVISISLLAFSSWEMRFQISSMSPCRQTSYTVKGCWTSDVLNHACIVCMCCMLCDITCVKFIGIPSKTHLAY